MSSAHFSHYAVTCNANEKRPIIPAGKNALSADEKSRRKYLLLENRSGATIYLNFDKQASADDGVQIVSGGFYELEQNAPDNAIHLVGTTAADQRINVTEAY